MLPLDYALYMAETENAFPDKRKASIDAAIADFVALKREGANPNLFIDSVLAKYNLKQCQLTASEKNYIMAAVDAS